MFLRLISFDDQTALPPFFKGLKSEGKEEELTRECRNGEGDER
jgi:hypothetical protein